jgi:hypothetical protein
MDDRSSTSRADPHAHAEASQEWRRTGTATVAIHDVAPATFARTALIRDWLDDHGIGRVTLFVVPAPDLPPLSTSSPELAEWLLERAAIGDEIAEQRSHRNGPREPLARAMRLSPLALRATGRAGRPLPRIDLHPGDLDHTRRMVALERVLCRARRTPSLDPVVSWSHSRLHC